MMTPTTKDAFGAKENEYACDYQNAMTPTMKVIYLANKNEKAAFCAKENKCRQD